MGCSSSCVCCGGLLTAGEQFVYEFESLKYAGDDVTLAAIRAIPWRFPGEPLRTCRVCRASVAARDAKIVAMRGKSSPDVRRVFAVIGFGVALLYMTGMLAELAKPRE